MTAGKSFSCFLILTAMFWASLYGCKKEQPSPSQAPPPPPKSAPKPVQKPMSSATAKSQQNVSIIDFAGKKDPFKPFAMALPSPVKAGVTRSGSLLPIHSYDVSQFKVIGIITGLKENRAMVVDPVGRPYVVKEGMTIGRNEGRIIRINPSSVEVQEEIKEDSGKKVRQMVRLNLPRKQEK